MNELTFGQYRELIVEERTLFNGLKWCLEKNKVNQIKKTSEDLKIVRNKIAVINAALKESFKNKKTIAKATA